jgi:hypothetical protein
MTRKGQEGKILYKDFEIVVKGCFDAGTFSSFQLQKVFKKISIGNVDFEKDYIPARDFKDAFYPGRPWNREDLDDKARTHKHRNIKDDDENLSEASMLID